MPLMTQWSEMRTHEKRNEERESVADSLKRCSSLLIHNGILPSVPVSPHPATFVPVKNAFLALTPTVNSVGIK